MTTQTKEFSGFGKGTKVLLWNGNAVNIESVYTTDRLMGVDGKPKRVLSLPKGFAKMYKLKYMSHELDVSASHPLILQTTDFHMVKTTPGGLTVFFFEFEGKVLKLARRDFEYTEFGTSHAEKLALGLVNELKLRSPKVIEWMTTVDQFAKLDVEVQQRTQLLCAPVKYESFMLSTSSELVAFFLGMWLGCGDPHAEKFTLLSGDLSPVAINQIKLKAKQMDYSVTESDCILDGYECLDINGDLDKEFHMKRITLEVDSEHMSFRNNYLNKLVTECFTTHNKQKAVPQWMLSVKKTAREEFLKGYTLSTDKVIDSVDLVAKSLGLSSIFDFSVGSNQPVKFTVEAMESDNFYGIEVEDDIFLLASTLMVSGTE